MSRLELLSRHTTESSRHARAIGNQACRAAGVGEAGEPLQLRGFLRHCDINATLIYAKVRIDGASAAPALTAARRTEILGPFAAYYRQFEVNTEVLPTHALGCGHRRLTPHIYTDEETQQLLRHADCLVPLGGLRPLMYRTLFGLLAAVGLRLSEALKLRVGDVDLEAATITVRQSKFHKSRCLPIHASVVRA